MKKILLIEDNDDIRNNTAELLEMSNYIVIVAENGKVGVKKAKEHLPDLIICDIMMPVLDGYGVLHTINKNEALKNIPFIFLTAKSEHNDFRKGMELGADDYITKPFSGTELLNAVDIRLKKADKLKEGMDSGKGEMQHLIQNSFGKEVIESFIKDRNINRYKKKQSVYSEGNHPVSLFYILKGKVKIFKTNENAKELVTDLFGTGDFFGYVALLEDTPYKDSAEALEETELALIPRQEFNELMQSNKEAAQKFIHLLAENISEKENHLLGLAYHSLRQKVAEALLLLQSKYRKSKSKDDKIVIDITRDNLATIAGTATESLIRTLTDFRSEKLIDIDGGLITIINQMGLEKLVNL